MKKKIRERLIIGAIATVLSTVAFELIWPESGLLENFLVAAAGAYAYQGIALLVEYFNQR
jgi:hypothetical protein